MHLLSSLKLIVAQKNSTPLTISYPAEIWPYNLRARGLAVTLFSTQAAVGFNIFVNPIALQAIG